MQKQANWESSSEKSNFRSSFRPANHISTTNSEKNQKGDRIRPTHQRDFYGQATNASKSSKTSQLLSSEGSSYSPSIGSISRKTPSDEYKKDSEEDIEEMRSFLSQNKYVLLKCRRRIDSQPQDQANQNFCFWTSLVVGLILLFLVVYMFSGKHPEVHHKIEAIATNCWQKFKLEKCDLNNPLGSLCRELYDCYLKQKHQRQGKQELGSVGSKKKESLVEEVLVSLVIAIIGYFVGLERLQRGAVVAIRLIGQFIQIIRQIRRRHQERRE